MASVISQKTGHFTSEKGRLKYRGGRRILSLGRAAQDKADAGFFSEAQRRNITVINICASEYNGIATGEQSTFRFPVNSDKKGHVPLLEKVQAEGWREFFLLERKSR